MKREMVSAKDGVVGLVLGCNIFMFPFTWVAICGAALILVFDI